MKKYKYLNSILLLVIFLFISIAGYPKGGGRMPTINIPPSFPGETIGTSRFSWVAPYVCSRDITIGKNHLTTVTWFSEDGQIIKEISGKHLEANSYYIRNRLGDTTIINSIYDTSSLIIIRDTINCTRGGSISGKDYGKYFWRDYSKNGFKWTDFYANAEFVGTFGPQYWFAGRLFNVNTTGSIAYSLMDTVNNNSCKIVSLDSLGNQTFSFNCDGPYIGVTPSPNGQCVVVNYNLDTINNRGSTDFACLYSSGEIVRANLYPNGRLIGWVPGNFNMIVTTALGADYTYRLLDWKTGEILWSVKDPLEYTPMTRAHGTVISEDYLLLSGLAIRESLPHGPVIPNQLEGTIRMLAAIDIKKGELVAKWYEPTFTGRWQVGTGTSPMPNSGGKLMWYKNELYHVTDVNFSKINFEDIQNYRNGWVPPNNSGNVIHNIH